MARGCCILNTTKRKPSSSLESQAIYNSGSELNQASGWYETMFRGYNAALGRFLQVDPLAAMTHSMSSYQYGNNDPVLMNDPLGLRAFDPVVYSNDWNPISGGGINSAWTNSDPAPSAADYERRNALRALGIDASFANGQLEYWVNDNYLDENGDAVFQATFVSIEKDQQEGPTAFRGAFVDPDDFYGFMQDQVSGNPVEVAAFVLKGKGDKDYRYFVLPWNGNTRGRSRAPVNQVGDYVPGYSQADVTGVVHTHPFGTEPSKDDKELRDYFKIPIYTIGPRVKIIYTLMV